MAKKLVFRVTSIFCITLFVGHFLFTLLDVIPFNPVSAKHNNQVYEYMEPLFNQTWELFAPDPVADNRTIYMQIKEENGEKSDWYDITSPKIEQNHSNLFSPHNRLVRIPTSSVISLFQEDSTSSLIKDNLTNEENHLTLEENLENHLDLHQERAKHKMYRYAFSEAGRLYEETNIAEVQLRLEITEVVPFSERNNEEYESESQYIEFPWEAYTNVASPY
ncbi:DUF5819 family protein [Salsuginibacillus kocurii]|uniref:DUF5819 family protein n=1 Tax=Salsuginibacillus kocurii TaxID=427078 RepID=UPI0003737094|nr:DUF5819 family protein [Salsuginibacillus kocurii]